MTDRDDIDPADELEALALAWPNAPAELWADLLEALEARREARTCPVVPDHGRTPARR
jgi:hypothetical protein